MAFPDRRLERPLEPPETHAENSQDVIPPTQRNQDPERSTHNLVSDTARPLTDDERKAADRDAPLGEPVYAPASERVPREPVAGHRDMVDHPDTATAERQAVNYADPQPVEPSFTRVPRPSNNPTPEPWTSSETGGSMLPMGMGWLMLGVTCGVGVWLWTRWRRERNKPINRIRRQAWQTWQNAYELRDRVPDLPDEATRPAMGLGTALLTLAIVLWQQSQSSRSRTERVQRKLSDREWQQRLMELRDRWNPSRIEFERISLPRR